MSLLAALPAIALAPGEGLAGSLGSRWAHVWAGLIVAGLLAGLALSLVRTHRDGIDRGYSIAAAVLAGLSLSIAAATTTGALDDFRLVAGPVLAVLVTLVLDYLHHRAAPGRIRPLLAGAAAGSLVVSASWLVVLLSQTMLPPSLDFTALRGSVGSVAPATAVFTPVVEWNESLLALVIIAVLAIGSVLLTGRQPIRVTIVTILVAATALLAPPALVTHAGIVAGFHLIALVAFATLFWNKAKPIPIPGIRAIAITVLAIGLAIGATLAHSGLITWIASTVIVLGVLLASRLLVTSEVGRALLLGAALLVGFYTAALAARVLRWPEGHVMPSGEIAASIDSAHLVAALAAVLLLLGALVRMRALSTADRHTAFWLPAATGLVTAIYLVVNPYVRRFDEPISGETAFYESMPVPYLPVPITTVIIGSVLLLGFAVWSVRRTLDSLVFARISAAIAIGPIILVVVDALARLAQLPPDLAAVAPASAGLLAAAGALVGALRTTQSVPRWARELGVVLVAVPALVIGAQGPGTLWLALLLSAVTAFLLAISKDGLFGSASPRKHLGWLALALATAGLWARLADRNVVELEPYVLPLAGALIVVGLLVARARRAQAERLGDADGPGGSRLVSPAPLIVLAGLLVALLPLGAAGITGEVLRPVIVFTVSAALLLAGSLLRRANWQSWLDALAIAGVVGVLVTGVGRALVAPRGMLDVDLWVGALALVLVIAAFGQAAHAANDPTENASAQLRSRVGTILALVALVAVLGLELAHVDSSTSGVIRALVLVLFFAAAHLIAALVDRAPLGAPTSWTAIALGLIAAVYGIGVDALDPAEVGTVPLAVALLASGAHRLSTTPTARSFPWLGPGLILLLVPSLVITAWDAPLWRLVALGVVAIATLIVGLTARLQAPFLIGAVVTLWHAIGTFWPQIVAVYEAVEWWLWLGIGGVLLVVLAARYERRMRDVRSLALKIAALR